MVHRHGETTELRHGLRVFGFEVPSSPTSEGNLLCTVCQIVQNGAVQPANAAPILPPSISVPLLLRITPSDCRSDLPAMNYGRAPPLV